jgi:hypothetical protein
VFLCFHLGKKIRERESQTVGGIERYADPGASMCVRARKCVCARSFARVCSCDREWGKGREGKLVSENLFALRKLWSLVENF